MLGMLQHMSLDSALYMYSQYCISRSCPTSMSKVPVMLVHIAYFCPSKNTQVVMGAQEVFCAWTALYATNERHSPGTYTNHVMCLMD